MEIGISLPPKELEEVIISYITMRGYKIHDPKVKITQDGGAVITAKHGTPAPVDNYNYR